MPLKKAKKEKGEKPRHKGLKISTEDGKMDTRTATPGKRNCARLRQKSKAKTTLTATERNLKEGKKIWRPI